MERGGARALTDIQERSIAAQEQAKRALSFQDKSRQSKNTYDLTLNIARVSERQRERATRNTVASWWHPGA